MKRNFKLDCDCYGFISFFFFILLFFIVWCAHDLMCMLEFMSYFCVLSSAASFHTLLDYFVHSFRVFFRSFSWKRVFFCWRYYSLITIDMLIHTYEISHDRFFPIIFMIISSKECFKKQYIHSEKKKRIKSNPTVFGGFRWRIEYAIKNWCLQPN